MRIFLVDAHPELRSFYDAMKDGAVSEFGQLGHDIVSDLYEMEVWAGAGWRDFESNDHARPLHLQTGQAEAAKTARFAPDIHAEIDGLTVCYTLILQFQLWWFSAPGIVTGWIDRVCIGSLLKHLLVDTLAFCRMEVLPSFVAYGPGRLDKAARDGLLEQIRQHLQCLFSPRPGSLKGGVDRFSWSAGGENERS
jgi:putative NADPH-quinone reductase